MNTSKYFMAFSAVALTAVTVSAPVYASSTHSFTDVGFRYDEAVGSLYEYGIIKGVNATTFGVHQTLTRGDAAVILANALFLDIDNAPDAGFTDLNSRVKGSVNALAEAGIVSGLTKSEFKPNDPLNRGAMAKILVLSFGLGSYAKQTPFQDAAGVFGPYIEALYGTGITSGKTVTSYGTYMDISRGDFANLLYNTLLFAAENYPSFDSVTVTTATSTEITFEKPIPPEYKAEDFKGFFYLDLRFEEGSQTTLETTNFSFSSDRTTLFISHADLNGKAGVLVADDSLYVIEAPFNFK